MRLLLRASHVVAHRFSACKPQAVDARARLIHCSNPLQIARRCSASAVGEDLSQELLGEDDVETERVIASYGARFLRRSSTYAEKKEKVRLATVDARLAKIVEETVDREQQIRLQIRKLFKQLPGKASCTTAFSLHQREKLEPVLKDPLKLKDEEFHEFEKIYKEERKLQWHERRIEVRKRRNKRRNYFLLNSGYKEEDEVYEAEVMQFQHDWRLKSILEDCWKAEYHTHLHRLAKTTIPERQKLASRTDRVADILGDALRSHVVDQNRPVLTHELADFENPYMSKRSTLERLLQEKCVRNQLDERCVPRVLDELPSLTKLRSEAKLPPEVLEPLAAFRGDTRWHFDARERLSQKLSAVDSALKAVGDSGGKLSEVVDALPENATVRADQVPGTKHPWRNHVGFESAVPRGVAGGTKMGQPMNSLDAEVLRLRYPTLQRVAHTLPADPKWRAHVARSIRVLERSRDWDFRSKLRAVNTMKEIYDNLRPSDYYTQKLDDKLPINRVPSHLKRKYARGAQYVRTFPKKWLLKKTHEWYRQSLTARNPKKKKQ